MRERVYKIFKKKRLEAKLSQAKLAKLARCKKSTITNIETGRCIPREKTICKLGKILGFSQHEIIKYLELARYNRRDRDEIQMEYVVKSAERILKRHRQ